MELAVNELQVQFLSMQHDKDLHYMNVNVLSAVAQVLH